MSFWGKVGGWLWGIDIDQEKRRAEELDKKIAEQNALARQRGIWDEAEYERAEANREAMKNNPEYTPDLWPEFAAGALEGLQAIPDRVSGAISSTAGWSARLIPRWLWLLIVIGGAWYLAVWLGLIRKGVFAR
jgi:hypothetical protein